MASTMKSKKLMDPTEILVKLGEETKLLEVPADCHQFQLTDAIRRRFRIPVGDSIGLHLFVKRYDDYVDVDDGTEITDGSKILVSRKRATSSGGTTSPDEVAASDGAPASDEPGMQSRSTVDIHDVDFSDDMPGRASTTNCDTKEVEVPTFDTASCSTAADKSFQLPTVGSTPSKTAVGVLASGDGSAILEMAISSPRSAVNRSPSIWVSDVWPRLSWACRAALASAETLNGQRWSELLDTFYCITKDKHPNPGALLYAKWSTELIEAFGAAVMLQPSLHESIMTVRSKLRTKFKNKRFRSRSPTSTDDGETPQKRLRRSEEGLVKTGLPYYFDDGKATEDAAAQTECVYRLKNDSTLSPEQADRLKEACFNTRRASLSRSRDALSDVKERYPWLFCEDEMWKEFHRVCGGPRRQRAKLALTKIFAEAAQRFFTASDEETLRAITDCLGGPPDSLRSPPVIMQGGQVTAEDLTLATYQSVPDGVLLWTVAHTVFCLSPCKKSTLVLQFVQHTCLGVREPQSASCRKAGKRVAALFSL